MVSIASASPPPSTYDLVGYDGVATGLFQSHLRSPYHLHKGSICSQNRSSCCFNRICVTTTIHMLSSTAPECRPASFNRICVTTTIHIVPYLDVLVKGSHLPICEASILHAAYAAFIICVESGI